MLRFVEIYIYWLTDTSSLAFSSRTVLGKKLLWRADVLAYIVWGITAWCSPSGWNVCWSSIYQVFICIVVYRICQEFKQKGCIVFPLLAARVFRSKFSNADVTLSLPLNPEISLTALCCTISMSCAIYSRLGFQTAAAYSTCGRHRPMYANNFAFFEPNCCFATNRFN